MNIYWVDVIFIVLIQVATHPYVDSYLVQVQFVFFDLLLYSRLVFVICKLPQVSDLVCS